MGLGTPHLQLNSVQQSGLQIGQSPHNFFMNLLPGGANAANIPQFNAGQGLPQQQQNFTSPANRMQHNAGGIAQIGNPSMGMMPGPH